MSTAWLFDTPLLQSDIEFPRALQKDRAIPDFFQWYLASDRGDELFKPAGVGRFAMTNSTCSTRNEEPIVRLPLT